MTTTTITSQPHGRNEDYASRVAIAGTLYHGLRSFELSNAPFPTEFYQRQKSAVELLAKTFDVKPEEIMGYHLPRKSAPCPLTHNILYPKKGHRLTGGEGTALC